MQNLLKAGPSVLLVAYTAKLVIVGAAMPDALIVAFLCSLVGVSHLIEHIKFRGAIQEKIEQLNTDLESTKGAIADQDGKVKEAISYVSNLKLKSSMRIG